MGLGEGWGPVRKVGVSVDGAWGEGWGTREEGGCACRWRVWRSTRQGVSVCGGGAGEGCVCGVWGCVCGGWGWRGVCLCGGGCVCVVGTISLAPSPFSLPAVHVQGAHHVHHHHHWRAVLHQPVPRKDVPRYVCVCVYVCSSSWRGWVESSMDCMVTGYDCTLTTKIACAIEMPTLSGSVQKPCIKVPSVYSAVQGSCVVWELFSYYGT